MQFIPKSGENTTVFGSDRLMLYGNNVEVQQREEIYTCKSLRTGFDRILYNSPAEFQGLLNIGALGFDQIQAFNFAVGSIRLWMPEAEREGMDWGNVSAGDLLNALQEVEWSAPPRPLAEFFARFTVPRSFSKWSGRVKCNLYFYRTNYFILLTLILGVSFVRNPLALVAALLAGFAIACLNDSFAITFSEKLTRIVRQFSPHLAAKMRPSTVPVIRGHPRKRTIHICGQPRHFIVFLISLVSALLLFISCGILRALWALLTGLLSIVVHASFRCPNLKARLNTFREEFRAVWRSYSEL